MVPQWDLGGNIIPPVGQHRFEGSHAEIEAEVTKSVVLILGAIGRDKPDQRDFYQRQILVEKRDGQSLGHAIWKVFSGLQFVAIADGWIPGNVVVDSSRESFLALYQAEAIGADIHFGNSPLESSMATMVSARSRSPSIASAP